MTTSGVVSFARTRSPTCALSAPVRPVDRRRDLGVLQVQPGVLDRGLVGLDRRRQGRGARAAGSRTGRGGSGRAGTGSRPAPAAPARSAASRCRAPAPPRACCSAAWKGRGIEAEQRLRPSGRPGPRRSGSLLSWPVTCARICTLDDRLDRADGRQGDGHRFLLNGSRHDRHRPAGAPSAAPPARTRVRGARGGARAQQQR